MGNLGWRKHKLESRLQGEISIISDMLNIQKTKIMHPELGRVLEMDWKEGRRWGVVVRIP